MESLFNTFALATLLKRDLRPATLVKKRLWHRCFFCEFCEISKNAFFTEHLRWLLLLIYLLVPFLCFLYFIGREANQAEEQAFTVTTIKYHQVLEHYEQDRKT